MKSNLELELENSSLRSELDFLLGYIRCAARENYNIIPSESVYLKGRIERALGEAEKLRNSPRQPEKKLKKDVDSARNSGMITRMKNKSFSQMDAVKSVRKTWDFRPVTRIVLDKTKYSRKRKHRNNTED